MYHTNLNYILSHNIVRIPNDSYPGRPAIQSYN